MKISKRIGVMTVIGLFSFVVMARVCYADNVVKVPLLTAPFGTGVYVLGSALEDIAIKNHPWLRISSIESPGLNYNTKMMEKDINFKKTSIVFQSDLNQFFASKGMKPFTEKMGEDVKVLAIAYHVALWFATLKPEIKNIRDLEGRKIGLGTKAQIGWAISPSWLLDIGFDMKGKIDYQWVGMEAAQRALLDGMVDAVPVLAYNDPIKSNIILSPQSIALIGSAKKVYHLSATEKACQRMKEEIGFNYYLVKIPADRIEGWDKEVLAVGGDYNYWAASEQFPENLAYEFVKLLINYCDKLKDYHALGKLTLKEGLCFGLKPEELHPGAYRAFKEAGLMK